MVTTNQSSVECSVLHACKQTVQQQNCDKSVRKGAKADATKTALTASESLL